MRVLAVIEVPKLFGRFILHSVRYASLIQAESPTNCDVHLAESLFQIGSRHGLSHSFVPERKSCTTENQKRSSHKAECSPK